MVTTKIAFAFATLFVLSAPASADVKVDTSTFPKNWTAVGQPKDQKDGEKCSVESGRKLVISDRFKVLPNGNRFYLFDCVPLNDARSAAK